MQFLFGFLVGGIVTAAGLLYLGYRMGLLFKNKQ